MSDAKRIKTEESASGDVPCLPTDVWTEVARHDTTRSLPTTCSALARACSNIPAHLKGDKTGNLCYLDGVVTLTVDHAKPMADLPWLASQGIRFPGARKLKVDERHVISELSPADLDAIATIVDLNALTAIHLFCTIETIGPLLGRLDLSSCKLLGLTLTPSAGNPENLVLPRALITRLLKLHVDFNILVGPETLNPGIRTLHAANITALEDARETAQGTMQCIGHGYVPPDSAMSTIRDLRRWYPSIQSLRLQDADISEIEGSTSEDMGPIYRALARGGHSFHVPTWIYPAILDPGTYMSERAFRAFIDGREPTEVSQFLLAYGARIHPRHVVRNILPISRLPTACVIHLFAHVLSSPGVPRGCAPTGIYAWTGVRARALVDLIANTLDAAAPQALRQLFQTCISDTRTGHLFAIRAALRVVDSIWSPHELRLCTSRALSIKFELMRMLPSTIFDRGVIDGLLATTQAWRRTLRPAPDGVDVIRDNLNTMRVMLGAKLSEWETRTAPAVRNETRD